MRFSMDKVTIRKAKTGEEIEIVTILDYVWKTTYKDIFTQELFLEKEKTRKRELRILQKT